MSSVAASIAATGIQAADQAMEIAAHNLSNQLSDGFKKTDPVFQNLIYQDVVGSVAGPQGSRSNIAIPTLQSGTGVRLASVIRDFRLGVSEPTKNQWDIYINGDGFIEVDRGDNMEPGYTRLGHLKVDSAGVLRTITDYPLTDNITIDMTKYTQLIISREGKVIGVDDKGDYNELGQITLRNFINPAGLEAHEDTLFTWTPEAGDPVQGDPGDPFFGEILQGYVERSNVDGPKELIRAVQAQRFGNSNAAILRMAQEMEKSNLSQIAQGA